MDMIYIKCQNYFHVLKLTQASYVKFGARKSEENRTYTKLTAWTQFLYCFGIYVALFPAFFS